MTYAHCNVAERLDVHNLIAGAIDTYGHIDVLVNNAGVVAGGDFLEIGEDDFDRMLAVNLKGAFLCSQASHGDGCPNAQPVNQFGVFIKDFPLIFIL